MDGDVAERSVTVRDGRTATRRIPRTSGTLYVVATPLGNLRDVTLRALDVLATADVIAAEDTRVTATLLRALRHRDADAVAARAQRGASARRSIVARSRAGKSVALVSDAGTPAVSDPVRGWCARCATRAIRWCRFPGRRR